jgi:hypothetical protein
MKVGAMISAGEISPNPENIELLRNVIKQDLG